MKDNDFESQEQFSLWVWLTQCKSSVFLNNSTETELGEFLELHLLENECEITFCYKIL